MQLHMLELCRVIFHQFCVCVCVCVRTYVRTFVCMYVNVCVYLCVCVYIYRVSQEECARLRESVP